jgi:hypothetical protein
MAQIKKRIEFNIKRGTLNAGLLSNSIDDLVQTIWLTITFWIPQQMFLGKKTTVNLYRKVLWSQIAPYLTTQGKKEFEKISSQQ